jgi:hypothetical protein
MSESKDDIDIYAYRGFSYNGIAHFEIMRLEGNYICLIISYLYDDAYSQDERYGSISNIFMKIKHHNNIDLYDMIKIVFDDIMQLCAHIVPYAIVIDRICGDVKKLEGVEIYDKVDISPTIQLTRENTKYITYYKYNTDDFDSDYPFYDYEGEILEDGTFVHNYVAPH